MGALLVGVDVELDCELLRHEALSGSDVGHGLLVALLVAFPVAWMTEVVVVVVGGFLASHMKVDFVNKICSYVELFLNQRIL